MIYRLKWLTLLVFLAGLIILLLPDKSKPLVEFNRSHGPSFPDLVGLIMMFISWVASTINIINNWNQLIVRLGNRTLPGMIFIYFVSIAGVITGLSMSMEWLLWVSVAVASIINIALIVSAYRIAANRS